MGEQSFDSLHGCFSLTIASGFLGELVLWSNFRSVANLVKSVLANWGPLSVQSSSGMPFSVKNSFRTEMVLEVLH